MLVRILRAEGAVIIGKTTTPQGVMHLDTTSNLLGQTLNPWNLALSPGGSSGGESALIAAGGSALGVGTDIGGSIRQPSAVCGLYGLRPTTKRLPLYGFRSIMPGNEGVGSSTGPMATSARDMSLFMSVILDAQPHRLDPGVLPIPWTPAPSYLHPFPSGQGQRRKLRIGIMACDGVVRAVTPVQRALDSVVAKLQAFASTEGQGWLELVSYNVPGDLHLRNWDLIRELYFLDGGALFNDLASVTGEPLLPLTQHILFPPVRAQGAGESWDANVRREAYRDEYLAFWNKQGIDALLCPACHTPAPRPGTIKYWGYTSAWNLVDYPGLVFPTTVRADVKLDEQYEVKLGKQPSLGEWDDNSRKECESPVESSPCK